MQTLFSPENVQARGPKYHVKKLLLGIAAPAVLALTAAQIQHAINSAYHTLFPSQLRNNFASFTGATLEGWSEDIEQSDTHLLHWTFTTFAREKAEADFSLHALKITPTQWSRKSAATHLDELISAGHSGTYNPLLQEIELSANAPYETIIHEIKHRKHFQFTDDQFTTKWMTLANTSGQAYLGSFDWLRAKTQGHQKVTPQLDKETLRAKGFISSYAMVDKYEDVAELATAVESHFGEIADLVENKQKYGILIKKVKLLEEYKLIPKHTIAMAELERMNRKIWGFRGSITILPAQEYLAASEQFLKINERSFYEADIRLRRARILRKLPAESSEMSTAYHRQALAEYDAALQAQGASIDAFSTAIVGARGLAWDIAIAARRDPEHDPIAMKYWQAEKIMWKGYHACDVTYQQKTRKALGF